jgi:hypothetical protein
MIRLSKIYLVLIVLSLSLPIWAQNQGSGLGVILGEPTGVSFKQWLTGSTAFDIGLAWSFNTSDAFHLHADYLIHAFDWIQSSDAFASQLNVYYGIGGRAKFEDDTKAGARGVIGLDYFFRGAPLDAFLEVAPILDLTPSTDFSLNLGLGLRYFFEPTIRNQ